MVMKQPGPAPAHNSLSIGSSWPRRIFTWSCSVLFFSFLQTEEDPFEDVEFLSSSWESWRESRGHPRWILSVFSQKHGTEGWKSTLDSRELLLRGNHVVCCLWILINWHYFLNRYPSKRQESIKRTREIKKEKGDKEWSVVISPSQRTSVGWPRLKKVGGRIVGSLAAKLQIHRQFNSQASALREVIPEQAHWTQVRDTCGS